MADYRSREISDSAVCAGIGDLERSIARLCASSLGAFGRDNASVVLYEDAAKRKVSAFLSVLKGLEKLQARTGAACLAKSPTRRLFLALGNTQQASTTRNPGNNYMLLQTLRSIILVDRVALLQPLRIRTRFQAVFFTSFGAKYIIHVS